MKARRVSILVIGLTVLGLTAGVLAGLLAARLPSVAASHPLPPPTAPGGVPQGLVEELGLTPQQQDQMRVIWEGVRTRVHRSLDDAQQLQKDRDAAVVALMNDQQKAQFEKISQEYAKKYAELEQKRQQAFEQAVKKTRELLTGEQRKRYDEILKERVPAAASSPAATTQLASPPPQPD
jgi:Spy/CpxP family protein refolding chaperone